MWPVFLGVRGSNTCHQKKHVLSEGRLVGIKSIDRAELAGSLGNVSNMLGQTKSGPETQQPVLPFA